LIKVYDFNSFLHLRLFFAEHGIGKEKFFRAQSGPIHQTESVLGRGEVGGQPVRASLIRLEQPYALERLQHELTAEEATAFFNQSYFLLRVSLLVPATPCACG